MPRIILITLILMVAQLGACTSGEIKTPSPDKNETSGMSNKTVETPQQPVGGTENSTGMPVGANPDEINQLRLGEEMLRQGQLENAIAVFEGIAASGYVPDSLKGKLISAHERYVDGIKDSKKAPPEILYEVLYSHYKRIIELDGENADAHTGLMTVMRWYESKSKTLPDKIDPLKFLPESLKDKS
ncbi:MAG: hypothetical protein ABIC40_05750 [bacterium]